MFLYRRLNLKKKKRNYILKFSLRNSFPIHARFPHVVPRFLVIRPPLMIAAETNMTRKLNGKFFCCSQKKTSTVQTA